MEITQNYYAFLGVSSNASIDDIKRAYARKRREYQNDEQKLSLLNSIYEVLFVEGQHKQIHNENTIPPTQAQDKQNQTPSYTPSVQSQTVSNMPPKGQNTDIKRDTMIFLLLQKWELGYGGFTEDWNVDVPPTLTDKFYVSSYRCPTCGRHMHKTVFPIGKESPIKIGEEYVFMKRVFTCATCQTFYTPLPEHKLSYGQFYFLKSLEYYDLLLAIYDKQGTTEGRPDA